MFVCYLGFINNLTQNVFICLQLVINAIKLIRSNALNMRLFAELCEENYKFQEYGVSTHVEYLNALYTEFEIRFEDV